MKAAMYRAFGKPLAIENLPDPTPPPSGVVIRVEATGLCRSDWHGWMGHDPDIRLPHIPGHELAGVVESVGPEVMKWKPGEQVTLPFVCGCGVCPQCASGNHQVCDHQFQPGFTHWGSFAEYVAIDYADVNLVRLPEELDYVTAASLGCRFVTSFRAVVDQGNVSAGQWVAVHGCGGVGLSAIMIADALGAQVVAIDIDDAKLNFARSIGADAVVNATQVDSVAECVCSITGGGAHVSIDALGSAVTCTNSILGLRKRGKHIQVGLMVGNDRSPLLPMDKVIANELEILGSHGIQAHRYPQLLEMIKAGQLQPKRLIGRTISLEDSLIELPNMSNFGGVGVTVIDQF
ncbi:zinc-dependent alcohol dehydrogenase family protein [Nodosilinea nodulosa]|uniref:zinc-dependent alcohol dehydrogenase family protein n=1 Tax=Nodosilinea nodulosa TaxID=416001 RepID=UPI00031A3858|nr:zinc-dependent alcohol dehydrogenase family protein [Nodosilinea nodulosa]